MKNIKVEFGIGLKSQIFLLFNLFIFATIQLIFVIIHESYYTF